MKRRKIRSLRAHPDEESRLICRLRQGDPAAFAELYEQYLPVITAYLRRTNHNRISSEDVVQEVFARIWQGRNRFRRDSSLKTYIFSIARNILREQQRRIKLETAVLQHSNSTVGQSGRGAEPEEILFHRELVGAIERGKSTLSEKERQALELMISANISAREAAEQVGCSYDAFRQRLHDGRKHLAQVLQELGWSGRAARARAKGKGP